MDAGALRVTSPGLGPRPQEAWASGGSPGSSGTLGWGRRPGLCMCRALMPRDFHLLVVTEAQWEHRWAVLPPTLTARPLTLIPRGPPHPGLPHPTLNLAVLPVTSLYVSNERCLPEKQRRAHLSSRWDQDLPLEVACKFLGTRIPEREPCVP